MVSTSNIDSTGNEFWKLPNGLLHREDGPAFICADGSQEWWNNGEQHREDGPAFIGSSGNIGWWLNDEWFFFDDYCDELRRNYGKTDEDIMMLGMQYV